MHLPKNLLTIYGRNAVLEALENSELTIYALHLAKTNKPSDKLNRMVKLAKKRNIEIKEHSKEQLSRISKNSKQDQGVALDIILNNFISIESLKSKKNYRVLALDNIENPQNLGMIIRSATAGSIDALIIPKKGSASLVSPLVIKASVGTLFKMPIVQCNSLYQTLNELAESEAKIITLDLRAKKELKEFQEPQKSIFVLGNETRGVSREIGTLAHFQLKIAMNRGVESLNVAVTASLIALCN